MKRSEMFEKIFVACPVCCKSRSINKSSYKGDLLVEPYVQECRACSNKQRRHNDESKKAISNKLTGRTLSAETKNKISDYRKLHPELWKILKPELGPISQIGTHHSDSSKDKISKGVSKSKRNNK